MTDGYVNPTGRGEQKDPRDALPVVIGQVGRTTHGRRPAVSASNAHNSPALGTSARGHIHAETTELCRDPFAVLTSETGGEPDVSPQTDNGVARGYKHVSVSK